MPIDPRAFAQRFPQVGVLPKSFLFGTDFSSFAAEVKDFLEVIRWTFYSAKAYATGGHVQLRFFDQNIGQATLQEADTNMNVGGMLSGGEAMIIRNIRIMPIPAIADVIAASATTFVALTEWYKILTLNGWLEFKVGEKLYIRGAPLTLFPAGQGIGAFAVGGGAGAVSVAPVQNGHPSNMALWELDPPAYVPSTRTIDLTLNWKVANTVTTAGRIMVQADGWKVRVVQ